MNKPQTRDTPRTDAFAGSCATYAALLAKKRMDPTAKASMAEIEFCLALGHANILEVELADTKKREAELDDTLGRIAQEFAALYEDSEKTDSVGEIYHLLRESGHLPMLTDPD